MNYSKLILAAITALLFVSCSDDDSDAGRRAPLGSYDYGVLVLNEGNFTSDNASVSYISEDFSVVQNDVFSIVNDEDLGDVAQSIGFYNELAYIVVNNSNSIQVVNRYTFKKVSKITADINNPRYIAFANGKGYVTNWGDPTNTNDDYVAVINLSTNAVSSKIPVVEGPERILENAGKLYVSHISRYGFSNSVSVVSNDALSTNITVGDLPDELNIIDGNLWVSCKGRPNYAAAGGTAGKFVKVNLSTNTVSGSLEFPTTTALTHLGKTAASGSEIFYNIGSKIYKVSSSATVLPSSPLFDAVGQNVSSVYGFAVNNSRIYIANAFGFDVSGKVHVYTSGENGTAAGDLLQTIGVGVGPSGFYFNQ